MLGFGDIFREEADGDGEGEEMGDIW